MPPSTRSSANSAAALLLAPGPLAIALVLLGAAALAATLVGPYALSPGAIARLLAARLSGAPVAESDAAVLFQIRLPRVAAAALVGAALASAGAAYQVTFRNPLVSPDILGVSAGAGLGAVVGIFLGLPVLSIQLLGFGFGLGTVGLVMLIASGMGRRGDTLALVLTGVAVGALAGAGIGLMKVLADPDDQLPAMTFWLLGSLAGIQSDDLVRALPAILLGLVPLVLMRWRIGVLALEEDEARALGVETRRLRLIVILGATLVTAAAVAVAGVVGWIGLMVPHIARLLAGAGFDRVLPLSAVLGAALMLLIDTLARTIATTEVPLGILTAVIGAPLFLVLLARRERQWR